MPNRLIIADDHQILIDGLTVALNSTGLWELLPPVNNGKQLLDRLSDVDVDLVLLDLNMPEMDGIKALEAIKQIYPHVKVLILTNYGQITVQQEVRRMGAEGYLLKNSPIAVLQEAIREILAGETYFLAIDEPVKVGNALFLDDFMKKFQLTRREVEIIKMIGLELTSREISDRLFISELTVSTHRKNILRKLSVKNIAGVINFAREHSLI
ncbi:two component transcriptional regulator, LuxR family [Filimonas lacunae]|uniref:Two component transcriptional regulator, LuxR family n=1 Tax=Filimonas lacunae TaxID=477680 RepID=A0A173MLT3_9BACT|nr:response regulator transcription factor [Filimonas lacunae]BAV08605.1 transcriptional regulator [Filimonas lacunae]SIS58329.1 two component transcriptional regulator, LuxR family [Filimonas lacunae]